MSEYIKREDVENMLVDADLIFDGEYLGYCRDDILIDKIPAADVVEVKHGKWVKATVSSGRESWECSVCHRRARGKKKNLPYCHCGAKMDLED